MTESEKQAIIEEVLSALSTNSRTIEQLTPATSLSSADWFEISGGRRVSYSVLSTLISQLSADDQSNLQTAIDKKELQSVSIVATYSSATLTIQSVGKTISCSIPVANSFTSGIITAADKIKLESAYSSAGSALTLANNAMTQANNAMTKANSAVTAAESAQESADTAQSGVDELKNRIGAASGIAPLDLNGLVPAANIPSTVASVLEFNGILPGSVTIMQMSSLLSPFTSNAYVVYSADVKRFILFVPNEGDETTGTYYANWIDGDAYGLSVASGREPISGKVYLDTTTGNLYRWDGEDLALVGLTLGETPTTAYPGDKGKANASAIANIRNKFANAEKLMKGLLCINANAYYGTDEPFSDIVEAVESFPDEFKQFGVVVTFLADEEGSWKAYQWASSAYDEEAISDSWSNSEKWKAFGGGGSAIGNCYNVTNERVASGEKIGEGTEASFYDSFGTAVAYVLAKGKAALGMQMTFAQALKSWKTYQYVGGSLEGFTDESNWIDLAGLSAGGESVININHLCDAPTETYNLSLAINALINKEEQTKVIYRKPGLVLVYRSGDYKWEAKLFLGTSITDITPTKAGDDLWKDLGGGGAAEVTTSDEPEDGGKDAFSTGGAYANIPVAIRKDTETAGTVKLALVNAKGQDIGDEVQFSVGTGSGGGGTEVSVLLEQSPLYANAGGTVVLKAAILSITKTGNTESYNTIESVQLIDRETRQVLETYNVNRASSADAETFDFEFDVSSYFVNAGTRKFQIVATDDNGNTGSKFVNITAVDVTIESTQTLNYTASTSLKAGTNAVSHINLYAFPKRAADILATIEIYIDGEWHTLGTATVQNTNSQLVSINPSNCCGHVLTHGAYPVRVHGVDVASGVVGNYLHTTIMVVDSSSATPLIAMRWYSEGVDASVKLYQSVEVDFAVYLPGANTANAKVYMGVSGAEEQESNQDVMASVTYTYKKKVTDVPYDGSTILNVYVESSSGNTAQSQTAPFKVDGTLLEISAVGGAEFNIDLTSRSNAESDHTISDNGVTLAVTGANWSTNGFVKDSFGNENYGTVNDDGRMALRIAENVTAELDYKPFDDASIETNGFAIQFQMRKRNMADEDFVIMSCISGGVGFYVTGKAVVFTTDNGASTAHTITAALEDDSVTDVIILAEPTSRAPYAGIGVAKIFFDGEEVGTCYYDAGTLARHATPISFSGMLGELYLYNIEAWRSYYTFEQAFHNYLLKKADTDAMLTEFAFNDVMVSQTAEGTTKNRPQASALHAIGIPYFVTCKNADQPDQDDQYPEYLETLNGDKKTKRTLDIYAYFPGRPWQDFKAIGVTVSNQGTTSSRRPLKNKKIKLKGSVITLLHSRDEFTNPQERAYYDACAANAANCKVQIYDRSLPTDIITVKVDYSESGGANNGASTHLFNDLQRTLGANYRTPAQNAYTGPYELNTSINSIPCAFFRTDKLSSDATSPSYGYFHAKGNWNEDKGDARVFGFEDVPGYNLGCLNYGDFVELVAERNQTLSEFASSIDKSEWDTEKVYMLSEFCGPNYKFFRYQNEAWAETTGTMTYGGGQWNISGDVLNPVENYEMKKYDWINWLQGVNSLDDLLEVDKDGVPVWLQNYESRYPDNDDLNALYEQGKKVPYRLYALLRWCQECNHHLTAEDGDITIQGTSVQGTAANRKLKFQKEFHTVANVHSFMCYKAYIDYLAAVDQESKNSMLGFYLDTDGVVRLYMNHLYDGDTILGSDNDCGLTVPYDINIDSDTGYYQGWDSVPYKQVAACENIWLNSTGTSVLTMRDVVKTMRTLTMSNGISPFSPAGLKYYWISLRLQKWPKLVSSYDGERKYIEHSSSAENYMYALHGLSIQRLEDFIDRRFKVRDGYYGFTGDIITDAIAMRACALESTGYEVSIKAAKSAFFGIGVDQMECNDSVYLEAGGTYTFHVNKYNTAAGYALYIFGASNLEEIDFSGIAISSQAFSMPTMPYLRKLIFGDENERQIFMGNGADLTSLNLGNMPMLQYLDVRNTTIQDINATYCPRIESILAEGSAMKSVTLAETSPISTLSLPASMQRLQLVNLPNLSYPGGLTLAGSSNITRLILSGCPKIDALAVIQDIISGANISQIRLTDLNITASPAILESLKAARGLDANGIQFDETNQNSGLTGRWIFDTLVEDEEAEALNAYFPELSVYNSQFSVVCYDDTEDFCENITNLDNNTGYQFNNDFVTSGHFKRLEELSHGVRGIYNSSTHEMEIEALDDENYNFLADGTSIDLSDQSGLGYDFYKYVPNHWYKGINDYKNQRKYSLRSIAENEPISTASRVVRCKISELLVQANAALVMSDNTIGNAPVITLNASNSVYAIDVDGMKQVRWPGINSDVLGCVFVGADGNIISTFNMGISSQQFDYMAGEDYLFCDVPVGAVRFMFTSMIGCDAQEAITVDSTALEAIEPDWVFRKEFLVGIYGMGQDGLSRARSISNTKAVVGTGSSSTSGEWTYDSNGVVTNLSVPASLNRTRQDCINLCEMRGEGFHAISYEQSKDLANIIMELTGTRDIQAICGRGCSAGYTCGTQTINGTNINALGNQTAKNTTSNVGNLMFGIQNFVACNYEWMAHVAVNVLSFKDWKAKRCPTDEGSYPIDARWHIYDVQSDTERAVQGINATDYCIGRVRHGRYMDIVASKLTSDKSQWNKNYSDVSYYSHRRCRVVGRAYDYASAGGGIVCSNAYYVSSDSNTGSGSRLAFSGRIVWRQPS